MSQDFHLECTPDKQHDTHHMVGEADDNDNEFVTDQDSQLVNKRTRVHKN